MKIKALITICLLVSFCFSAYGEPEINDEYSLVDGGRTLNFKSTNVNNGSDIIIYGKNFGSKSVNRDNVNYPNIPMVWQNLEKGTNGAYIASDRSFGTNECDDCWSDYSALSSQGTEPPKYSNLNNRPGSKLNSMHHFVIGNIIGSNYSDSILAYEGKKELKDRVFVSFWVRWNWGKTGDGDYQHKLFKMVHEDSLHSMPGIMLNCFKRATATDYYNLTVLHDLQSTQINPTELKHINDINPFGDEQWGLFQIWIKAGVAGTENVGEVHARYFRIGETKVNKDWFGTTLSESYWKDFLFGMTIANVEDPYTIDTTYHFDDIYIDDSWARIEIGDKPVYNNCTHREMQIPKKWNPNMSNSSNDMISFQLNKGSFSSGQPVYLFVVDNNGNVSDGKGLIFN